MLAVSFHIILLLTAIFNSNRVDRILKQPEAIRDPIPDWNGSLSHLLLTYTQYKVWPDKIPMGFSLHLLEKMMEDHLIMSRGYRTITNLLYLKLKP